MKKLVFLGGTCGNNNWRESFTESLAVHGLGEYLFNPVVEDWNEEDQRREEEAKANASHLVFYIADSKLPGAPISGYSMVEAVMALYDKPEISVVVFDTEGMSGHPLKAMNQILKVLKKRFPNANIFGTPKEAADWLVKQLTD